MSLDGLFLGREKRWKVTRGRIAAKSKAVAYRRHKILLWESLRELEANSSLRRSSNKTSPWILFCS